MLCQRGLFAELLTDLVDPPLVDLDVVLQLRVRLDVLLAHLMDIMANLDVVLTDLELLLAHCAAAAVKLWGLGPEDEPIAILCADWLARE